MRRTAIIVTALLAAGAAHAQETTGGITPYPAGFFADARPANAYDMLLRLPGFSLEAGDSAVRGLAGASGNVLIDGRRPASKEDLEDVLKRIPAGAVDRIELIRAGAAGFDMQGRALVANVVRRREVTVRGEIEAELGVYGDGRLGPQLSAELNRRSGDRSLELSAAIGREAEDDKGRGPKVRRSPAGATLEAFDYLEREWEDSAQATIGYEAPWLGGALRLDGSARREDTRANIREQDLAPGGALEVVSEREDLFQGEVGGQYRRQLRGWSSELVALHRWSWSHARDVSIEDDEQSRVGEAFRASESIVRGVIRRDLGSWTVEGGGEGAFNVLDSHSALEEDGEAVDLPFADVRIEELRVETFATATWRARPDLTVEGSLRFERSVLRQTGDSQLEKPLAYWKPRLLVSWSAAPRDELRLEVDRHVGQLDFADFVSSTSLTSETVTAGNPDLEPERFWRASLAWRRQFGDDGGVTVTLRHDWMDDVVDHIVMDAGGVAFDAVGNIGRGQRTEVQITATLPLDRLGAPGALLSGDVIWRDSRVADPFTGRSRRISEEPRVEGAVHFARDLPHGLRWGVDVDLAVTERQYLFDEVRTDTEEARVALFIEYRPQAQWRVRVKAENLTSGQVLRRREQYDGDRGSASLRRIESRAMDFGPYVSVAVTRSFGR